MTRCPSCSQNAHDKTVLVRCAQSRAPWPLLPRETILVRRVLLREEGMEPDDLLCSRNARSRTPLVGRAQWKINQPPSLKKQQVRAR